MEFKRGDVILTQDGELVVLLKLIKNIGWDCLYLYCPSDICTGKDAFLYHGQVARGEKMKGDRDESPEAPYPGGSDPGAFSLTNAEKMPLGIDYWITEGVPDKENDINTAFHTLWHDISRWSQDTFGTDDARGPVGPLKHLKLEVDEALASGAEGEYADCLMLILDAARRRGLGPNKLLTITGEKLLVNRGRSWPKPGHNEAVQHHGSTRVI